MEQMREQAERFGARISYDDATRVDLTGRSRSPGAPPATDSSSADKTSPSSAAAIRPWKRALAIKRFARNPRIARGCADLRITQELGEGRTFDEMRGAGLSDPRYRQTAGSVQLTLSGEPTERRLTGALPSLRQQVLAALREAPELSTGEVSELTGAARPAVLRHMDALRNAGYVQWVGKSRKDPRASWRLIR